MFIFRHGGDLCEEEFLQSLRHHHDVLPSLVVHIAVGEHGVEVLDALLRRPVVVVVQPLLDCSKIHRMFDDLVVVGDVQLVRINRSLGEGEISK